MNKRMSGTELKTAAIAASPEVERLLGHIEALNEEIDRLEGDLDLCDKLAKNYSDRADSLAEETATVEECSGVMAMEENRKARELLKRCGYSGDLEKEVRAFLDGDKS